VVAIVWRAATHQRPLLSKAAVAHRDITPAEHIACVIEAYSVCDEAIAHSAQADG
jgi:hypothetical protein